MHGDAPANFLCENGNQNGRGGVRYRLRRHNHGLSQALCHPRVSHRVSSVQIGRPTMRTMPPSLLNFTLSSSGNLRVCLAGVLSPVERRRMFTPGAIPVRLKHIPKGETGNSGRLSALVLVRVRLPLSVFYRLSIPGRRWYEQREQNLALQGHQSGSRSRSPKPV